MAQIVCKRNKFGYCYFGDRCKNLHIEEKCVDKECDILNCDKRHPRSCNFFREYRRCKFLDFCRYEHVEPFSEKLIEQLDDKIKVFEKLLEKKDVENKSLKKEIESNKNRMESLEKKLNSMENMLENIVVKVDKTDNLEILETKNKIFREQTRDCFKILAAKIDEEVIDGMGFEKEMINFYDENIDEQSKTDLLEETFNNPSIGYPCENCDFIGKSKSGLKTHQKKKHK